MRTKDKSLTIYIVSILTLITVIIGTTFAFFMAKAEYDNQIVTGRTADINHYITMRYIFGDENSVLTPISDSEVTTAIKNQCQNNTNKLCQVYKFTIVNDSSAPVTLKGKIEFLEEEGSNIDGLKWGIIDYDENGEFLPVVRGLYSKDETELFDLETNNEITLNGKTDNEEDTSNTQDMYVVAYVNPVDGETVIENKGSYYVNISVFVEGGENGIYATFGS